MGRRTSTRKQRKQARASNDKSTEAARPRWTTLKLFPGIGVGEHGPAVMVGVKGIERPIFLRQSATDSACGQMCVFMALIALGLFERRQLTDENPKYDASVERMFRRAVRYHFTGTGFVTLKRIVQPFKEKIHWRTMGERKRPLVDFVLEQLRNGQLTVLGVENPKRQFYHWTLVIGVSGFEEEGRFRAKSFLLLDPSQDQPQQTPWNNTVSVDPLRSRGRYRLMRNLQGKERVAALNGAIAIGRKK